MATWDCRALRLRDPTDQIVPAAVGQSARAVRCDFWGCCGSGSAAVAEREGILSSTFVIKAVRVSPWRVLVGRCRSQALGVEWCGEASCSC